MKQKKQKYEGLTVFNLEQAIKLCHSKRGAGKSKWTKVSLEFEFKGGNSSTETGLMILNQLLGSFPMMSINEMTINKEEVQTDIETNPNWNDENVN